MLKRSMLKQTILISTIVASMTIYATARGNQGTVRGGSYVATTSTTTTTTPTTTSTLISTIPVSDLTDTQKEELTFMLEEEKLARDVYLYLYDLWGSRVFENIANSEQQHVDSLKALVDKYGLELPSTIDTQGEFQNADLQDLYDTLIEKGNLSLIDALEVGVTIEETDISDLQNILAEGVPEDFEIVYQSLLDGSYKHLDAFNRQLGR